MSRHDPRRALSRLSPGTVSIEPSIGGQPAYTSSDVAGACAAMDDMQWQVNALKWAGQKRELPRLFYSLYQEVIEIALQEGWRVPRGKEHLRWMTMMAIYENVDPRPCRTCRGTQYVQGRACTTCDATGIRRVQEKEKAAALGMSPQAFEKSWSHRYEMIFRRVHYAEQEGLREAARQLTETWL